MPSTKTPRKHSPSELRACLYHLLRHGKKGSLGLRHPTNTQTLANCLGVTKRTVERLLRQFREDYRLPLACDSKTHNHYFADVVPENLPLGPLLDAEQQLALAVAREFLTTLNGQALVDQLQEGFRRVTGADFGQIDVPGGYGVGDFITIRAPGAGVVRPKVFPAIFNCLVHQRVLSVTYQSKTSPTPSARRLHPYHLAYVENRWILIARDTSLAEDQHPIRTYVVARFSSPRWGDDMFERPAGFDPSPYVQSAFGAHAGSERHDVRLRIAAVGAHHVIERHWHESQTLEVQPDGSVLVRYTVSHLGDITRWVLGFGADCEVLGPPELREHVASEAKRLANKY